MKRFENEPPRTLAQLGQPEMDWLSRRSTPSPKTSIQKEAVGAALDSRTSRGILNALDQETFILKGWFEENLTGFKDWMAAGHLIIGGLAMDGEHGIGITPKGQSIARKIFEPRNPQQQ